MNCQLALALLVMICVAGCSDLVTSVNRDRARALARAEKKKEKESEQKKDKPEKADPPSGEVVLVEAKAGVGKRGQRLKADHVNQTIVRPVQAMIHFEQRAELEFKLKKAIDLYKAEHGELPSTHEEFMEKIVEPNLIKLPELPPDQRYVWDAKQGQLMVEMPKE